MKQDIILAGVGGQGILTVAFLLDSAAVARGWRLKQAEVHGMAQRGGAVYSHLRFSDREVVSDMVPLGQADMILAVEPLEVQRYVPFLRPGGVVVANREPHKNIPDYPADQVVLDAVLALPRAVLIDAKGIAEAAGVPKAQNMAMVGAATPFLPFELEDFRPIVNAMFGAKGEKVVAANMAALEAGYRIGAACKALLDQGVGSAETARRVTAPA
ncbi:MAG: indolepyruvate oxidoreductase subunit beta [Deltaproteobacteria bacterium]|nr:indolepyruvate oxidoreductase subunit beta [Deltaproteobacteria bacterium]